MQLLRLLSRTVVCMQVRAHTASAVAADDSEAGIDLDAMIPSHVRASMRRLAKSMLAAGDTTCVKAGPHTSAA